MLSLLSEKLNHLKHISVSSILKIINLVEPPIIICGCGRSGTTLLLGILDAHPSIQAVKSESRIFKQWRYRSSRINKWFHLLKVYVLLCQHKIKSTANRWAEKTPQNVQYIPQIIEEFGTNVRIIHIIRDGRDVVTSKHPRFKDQYFIPPEHWAKTVTLGLKYHDHPQVHTLRYESLIQDFDRTASSLMDFLDLELTKEVREFYRYSSLTNPETLDQPLGKLYDHSIGKWQNTDHEERINEFYSCEMAVNVMKNLKMIYH